MYRRNGRSMLLIACVGTLLFACESGVTPAEPVKVVTVAVTEQPTPTRAAAVTSTPVPVKLSTPTAAVDKGLLFEERFDTDKGTWFKGPDKSTRAVCDGSVNQGKYTLNALINTAYSDCNTELPAFKVSDGAFAVQTSIASTTAGVGEVNIGLLWRLQEDGQSEAFYFFNDGSYRALHWKGGVPTELLKRTSSQYVNLTLGTTNVFSVTAQEKLFTVFANGHLLYAITSAKAAPDGKLALQISANKIGQKLAVDFDDVLVTQPVDVPSSQGLIAIAPTATKGPVVVNTPRPTTIAATVAPAPTTVPATVAAVADQYILYFHFGAQGCPNSRRTGPAVESFYKAYAGRVQVIGVPVPGWGSNVDDFRKATGITFPVQNGAGPKVDTNRIPVIVLVNQRTGAQMVISKGVISYPSLTNSVSGVMIGRKTTVYVGKS